MYTQHTNSRHISLSIKYFYIAYEAYRLLRVRLKSSYQLLAAIADIWAVSFVVGGGGVDGETNTGFHHCHRKALRELSEQDRGILKSMIGDVRCCVRARSNKS